jgi:PPP family 3-phenylpropionic acid transporter
VIGLSAVGCRSTTAAFFILYAAMYGAFGVASPFWPRFFELRGLSSQELAMVLGLGTLMRLISGPLIGRLADVSGELRIVLAICLVLSAWSALSLLLADAFWPLLMIHLAQAAALAPVTTIADALAVSYAKHQIAGRFEYGRIRGTASAAFIAGTLTAGLMLGGGSAIVWMHAALLAAAAGSCLLLARPGITPPRRSFSLASFAGGVRKLRRIPVFRRVIVVSALVFGSHAVHDAFAVIRWNEAGIGPVMISVLWSEAVAAEVLVFVVIGPVLVNRLGTNGAATLAAAAGVLRWCVSASTTSTVLLAMVQPLHGLTFALLHLACMRLIGFVVPTRLAATAQALYALGAGLVTAVLTMLAGQLYATWAGAAFLPMALLCGLALPLARAGMRQPASSQEQQRGSVA